MSRPASPQPRLVLRDTTPCVHATAMRHLAHIQQDGLRPRSYWSADPRLTAYYADEITDEDDTPVFLRTTWGTLAPYALEPDYPGLEEPILTVLRRTLGAPTLDEATLWSWWRTTPQRAADSLQLIGSCRLLERLPPAAFQVVLTLSEAFGP